ncbi:hypothetical protein HYE02_03795 [Mycoplasmopsis bovis]|nr:hypothetical protein [Mycoplasmopsis bovis]QQH28369.1 hypothetical protein HYE02_03795 [Mycoplasmopsis bovis]
MMILKKDNVFKNKLEKDKNKTDKTHTNKDSIRKICKLIKLQTMPANGSS